MFNKKTSKTFMHNLYYTSNPTSKPSEQPGSPQPLLFSPRTQSQLTNFFKHIGYGEQTEAEEMIQSNPKLVLAYGDLTDCSKRTWREITAFQYAVLVLDYHMWSMLIKYLDEIQIYEQLEELDNNASLKGDGWVIKSTSAHKWPTVGWAKLTEALDAYIKNYDCWTSEQCRTHWCQQVGCSQLTLPAHVINEYSHPSRSFYPCLKWGNNEASLPREGVSDWNIADNGQYNLGKDFAWFRGGLLDRIRGGGNKGDNMYNRFAAPTDDDMKWLVVADRVAVNELLRVRIKQAQILLEKKLQSKTSNLLGLIM